ncbi:DUF1385 domain-containing protein, partial [Listeria monocytogenes]
KEPSDDQVEVAIASFNELLRVEKEGAPIDVVEPDNLELLE